MASPESGLTARIYFRGQRASSSNGANPHHAQTLFLRDSRHLSRCRRLGGDGHAAWGIEDIGNALNQPRTGRTLNSCQASLLGHSPLRRQRLLFSLEAISESNTGMTTSR